MNVKCKMRNVKCKMMNVKCKMMNVKGNRGWLFFHIKFGGLDAFGNNGNQLGVFI